MPTPNSNRRLNKLSIEHQLIATISKLRNSGLSHRKIAAEVGLSHGSVQRILKWQETGEKPGPSKPAIPKRPRNGQGAFPDFQRVSDFEAKGLTVKEAWQDYAKGCAKPYTYAHFSTLYKLWLAEQSKAGSEEDRTDSLASFAFDDVSADEDRMAEVYWKRKAD